MKHKNNIALVRGAFLNKYEMQVYESLASEFNFTAFGSKKPMHDQFAFPVHKLYSPMDIPNYPFRMPLLNRLFIDAHYLYGLEKKLTGFDIAHSAQTYYHYTQQSLNAKKKGYVKRVIVTELDNIPFNNEGIRGRKKFKQRAYQEVDHFIAISKLSQQMLEIEGVESTKISLIGSSIDTTLFKPVAKKKNPKQITVLYVGRLEEYKGIFEILYAAKLLIDDNDLKQFDVRFRFVGTGSQRTKMDKLINRLKIKNISYDQLPYEKIQKAYNNADIFVAPSRPTPTWQEQFAYTLLEAQACALPIITTHTGAIPENVGDAAILISPGNFNDLANAIKRFIIYPKTAYELGKKARIRAKTVHDVKIAASKIKDLYLSLL